MLQFGVVGYHLYLLYYTGSPYNASEERRITNAYVTDRVSNLAADGCRVTFTDKNVKVIRERSRDAHDVNLAMMDAYLDDGVDFFMLLFPEVRAPTGRDLQHLPSRSNSVCCMRLYCNRRSRSRAYAVCKSRRMQPAE